MISVKRKMKRNWRERQRLGVMKARSFIVKAKNRISIDQLSDDKTLLGLGSIRSRIY